MARVYMARWLAAHATVSKALLRSNDSRCHEFLRGHVSPLKHLERSALALDYVSLFSRIRGPPSWREILFVHNGTLSSIVLFTRFSRYYTFFYYTFLRTKCVNK